MKNRIAWAVATFVVLDLCTLAFSYSIAKQVERDAVAINLAGRQRMLSQRITKAALLAVNPKRSEMQRAVSVTELGASIETFLRTLKAFAEGGETTGGDGRTVQLESVRGTAAVLVGQVRGEFKNWTRAPTAYADLVAFSQFMDERNGEILESMNQLTSELESDSISAVSKLRIAQSLAFALSFANFLFILVTMHRTRIAAETASVTDALTGLLNRGGFYRELKASIERSHTSNISLGVMLLDLNEFKAVNDTYGHSAGDATLREVARRMQDFIRPDWVCGRLGGDEFAVICPALTKESLADAAKQLSSILGGIPGGGQTVSASIGWCYVEPGQSADEIVAIADAKMYSVKTEHRVMRGHRDKQR